MRNNASAPFGVITSFEGPNALLLLRGSVEDLDSVEFGASLDAAIDQHPESMVLDLTELDFIGAAGMVAVANAEKRLAEMGTRLTVRSPSDLVNGLLGLMATDEVAQLSAPGQATGVSGRLGAEQQGGRPVLWGLNEHGGATEVFRKVTAMPSDPDVVDGALRLVVELARALVEGADGVSVSLQRHGRLSTVAASDQTIMEMDADQYSTGEGPCVDASLKGHWFHAESLETETRWPSFTPQAFGLGIRSILSSPLLAFAQPVGALNIYSRTALVFDVKAQAAAAVFAKKASVILSDAGAGVTDTRMAFRYQDALRSRRSITLATGVLMEREGIDEDDAFTALLRLSLYHGEPLRGQAEAMVRSSRQPEIMPESGSNE